MRQPLWPVSSLKTNWRATEQFALLGAGANASSNNKVVTQQKQAKLVPSLDPKPPQGIWAHRVGI